MYRVGFPGWKVAARLGVPLVVRVAVVKDDEAGVLVATSPDLRGLVVESPTREELLTSLFECTEMLLEDMLHKPLKTRLWRHGMVAFWPHERVLQPSDSRAQAARLFFFQAKRFPPDLDERNHLSHRFHELRISLHC